MNNPHLRKNIEHIFVMGGGVIKEPDQLLPKKCKLILRASAMW
jgi:hypothetical protein